MTNSVERSLVLVRHGQSEGNLKNIFTGWNDLGLTEHGIAEARAVGKRLQTLGSGFDVAFTSTLRRAWQSCAIILKAMGQSNIPEFRDPALNERDYGELTGLNKDGPAIRRREAAYLGIQAAPDGYALLAGDFNSASPHDPEPEGFDALSAHHRARYLADDLRTADRSVLAQLEAAGWVDLGHSLGGSNVPTVPTAGFTGTEFAVMRCDYMLSSKALASHATSYEVIRTETTDMASDHYPVLATFEVPS